MYWVPMQTDHRCAMTSISNGDWTIEVAMRCDDQKRFKVLPCRWVVEHTFAWLGRFHRLTKDCEKSIQSSTAWTLIAHIPILMRRLARYWDKVRTLESGSRQVVLIRWID